MEVLFMSVKGYDTNVQLTQTKINVLKADTNWHSLNAMGTRCIVCGYDGPVAYPQKGGTDGETE